MKIDFIIPKNNVFNSIGLLVNSDQASFVFPREYLNEGVSIKEKKAEALVLLNLLGKIKIETGTKSEFNKYDAFFSMVFLIKDYLRNGIYNDEEITYSYNKKGKIDWKKTLNNSSILFDATYKNLLYRDFVIKTHNYNDKNLISAIYKHCLDLSIHTIGFLFNIDIDVKTVELNDSRRKFFVHFLSNKLLQTFNDKKKTLFNHLLTILKNEDNSNSFSLLINEREFEYIFEKMNLKVFGNENVSDYYNKYSYNINGNDYLSSTLRPDIIYKDQVKKVYYIIDSKYYQYGYSKRIEDLPASSSIAKQISYNEYLRKNILCDNGDLRKVRSLFLLPFNGKNDKEFELLKYVGYAHQNTLKSRDTKDFIPIILVDLKSLVHAYLNLTSALSIEKLNEKISKIFSF